MDKLSYYCYQYWFDIQDPRTKHYPLINYTPLPIVSILFVYYLLVTKVIPNYMKTRKPFELRKPMFVYNLSMVLINAYFFCEALKKMNAERNLFDFKYPTDRSVTLIITAELFKGFLYLLSKFADLIDTFFFALRKRDSHITLLHLYHHISVPIFGWLLFKMCPFIPGAMLFGVVNCFIHVIMYSYYLLSSFGPSMQKYLWWKRYITQLQLIQFIIYGIYGMIGFPLQTGYPTFWIYVALPQPIFFFYMFYDFYRKSYKIKKQ